MLCVPVSPRFLLGSSTKNSLMVRAGDTVRVPVKFEVSESKGCGEGPEPPWEPGSPLSLAPSSPFWPLLRDGSLCCKEGGRRRVLFEGPALTWPPGGHPAPVCESL